LIVKNGAGAVEEVGTGSHLDEKCITEGEGVLGNKTPIGVIGEG
jgi:hypothetical protein